MSKTSQANKIAKEAQATAGRKASDSSAVAEELVKETVAEVNPEVVNEVVETVAEEVKTVRVSRVRGKKYQKVRKLVDPNKLYTLKVAVNLVKDTSISKFDGKIEAHVTILDIGNAGEIVFPHLETASKNIVILNDAVLAEIKDGKINFDVLIATPVTMPKLLPYAKLLGPKGLMPNPKIGTLTDNPEAALKKLSVAKTIIKTEKKAPVVHIIVGKVSQKAEELIANIDELIKVIKPIKIKKLALCATMGPSVKVEIIK